MSKIVLCADDSVTMQTVAEMTLRASPYTFEGATSAQQALEKARANKPAVILADAVMPGKTGYELCAEVKSDPQLKDIPVLVVCGNSEAYDAVRGSEAGAAGHIIKPWDSQVLIDKLGEILSGKSEAAAKPAAAPSASAVAAAASASTRRPKDARNKSTIMGMPAVSLPGGVAPTVKPPAQQARKAQPAPRSPAKAPAKAPEPARPTAKQPSTKSAPVPASKPAPTAAKADRPTIETPAPVFESGARASAGSDPARAPMIQAEAKRTPSSPAGAGRKVRPASIPVAAAKVAEEAGLDPNGPEMGTLLKLSQAVVERVVWEIVPDLAETIIREHVQRLSAKQ